MAKMIRVKSVDYNNTNRPFTEYMSVEHITRVVDVMSGDPMFWKEVKKLDVCCEVWFNGQVGRIVLESAESLVRRIERSLMGE